MRGFGHEWIDVLKVMEGGFPAENSDEIINQTLATLTFPQLHEFRLTSPETPFIWPHRNFLELSAVPSSSPK
jgi:hypothetical protein